MKTNADFLHVRGSEIVNGQGDVIRLCGFCLGGWMNLDETLRFAICDGVLSRMLLPAFAEQFRGMNEDEIDQMMQSFALRNCVQRDGLVRLIRARLLGRTRR